MGAKIRWGKIERNGNLRMVKLEKNKTYHLHMITFIYHMLFLLPAEGEEVYISKSLLIVSGRDTFSKLTLRIFQLFMTFFP